MVDIRTTKMVYFALCQSIINYCIIAWGGAGKVHMLEVERAQRVILKVGAGLPYQYPTSHLYERWDVLSVRQMFIMTVLLKTFPVGL